MPITSTGYDGYLFEGDQAVMTARYGADYGVEGAGDFKVTAATGRAVSIAAGAANGRGIRDVQDDVATLALDAVATGAGSRWDLVALRRDWQPVNGGPSSLVAVTGTSMLALPGARLTEPGVQDDHPLALVRVLEGVDGIDQIIDLRTWFGNGNLIGADDLCRSFLATLGTAITIGSRQWFYRVGSTGTPEWADLRALDSTVWDSNAFSVQADWEITAQNTKRVGPIVSAFLALRRTGNAIPISPEGNIPNSTIATIAATYKPAPAQNSGALTTTHTGRTVSVGVSSSGLVQLAAIAGTTPFATNETVTVQGTWFAE